MELTVWTYEGPPHVGAMRIATALRDVHYVLHAPQGDTYADLLFTMIERRPAVLRSPTPHSRRGTSAATPPALFKDGGAGGLRPLPAAGDARGRLLHGRTDPGRPGGTRHLAWVCRCRSSRSSCRSYQRKENWGASETFYQLVRTLAVPVDAAPARDP
jgi:light-independent protochlorophyllide reductase subunit B